MTARGRMRGWTVAGSLVGGATAFGLGLFLAGQGIERADQWASVISVFVALAGLLAAGYGIILARRPQPAGAGPVRNTIAEGAVTGPALLVRDVRRTSLTGTPIPPSPESARAAEPGEVENRVEGGTFYGMLIMGRDLTDVVLPPSPPPGDVRDGDGR
ncbi:hypothetical protein QLQ12_29035 [Actinoplanes sp. NEAU-A12]|uniref:Uncharacterized protein n=1 Tax=Actinoplanes sandaracinus TaxID=3045177 RepID=A0ABT6WSF2_9ACTN|nr:hypothetical protein [Actinoplanes sandaracinus]MDI6102671.1 hypothetical protein [Actinoplanes sandaracinus]